MKSQSFKYFLDVIVPPLLVTSGILFNLLIILVYSRHKFTSLPTRNIWRLLSLVHIFCLLQIIKYFTINAFSFDLYLISPFTCKLVAFFSHSGLLASWLEIYITLDRLLTIINSTRFHKQLTRHQLLICLFIFVFYFAFFSHRFIFNEIVFVNATNTTKCSTKPEYEATYGILKWIDTALSAIVPFLIMFTSSIFLIYSIFKARDRLGKMLGDPVVKRRKLKRDIKFSVTLLMMNIVFLVCKAPVIVFLALNQDIISLWFSILDDLYYFSYVVGLFIYLMTNSIFAKEFLSMLKLKHIFCRYKIYK